MKRHSILELGLVTVLSLAIAIPSDVAAQAAARQGSGQRAGEVSRMIPQVRIVRGSQQITGAANSPVDWGDLVNTQRDGRARISLDDGSILNVGSESSLKVTQYTPGAQQSEIELTYGRLRSKVSKITQPGGKFEVRTPVGVAGVVGTDFYMSYQNGILQLIVYEGAVRFCNLAAICVVVTGGLMSAIRGNNQPPDQPTQATPSQLMEGGETTEVVAPLTAAGAAAAAPNLSTLAIVALTLLVVVPAIVIPLTVPHNSGGAVRNAGTACGGPNQQTCP
jgi:ferric-dicitrate binding protein FerR (iron transport regulator)